MYLKKFITLPKIYFFTIRKKGLKAEGPLYFLKILGVKRPWKLIKSEKQIPYVFSPLKPSDTQNAIRASLYGSEYEFRVLG